MTTPNHIAGGIVITGIIASLWDINFFEKWQYLCTTILGCLIPDIDHRKTVLGKIFYPIAKFLDTRFGHRTITHSLVFVITCYLIFIFFIGKDYAILFTSAVISHLILDMVTVQGVPLLYPFYRNPCVLPGRPDVRIRTGDYRTEIIGFFIFIVVGFSLLPLFSQGFWLSYNRQLGTRKQLLSQFKKSDCILLVEYHYRRDFNHHKGVGYCLKASKNTITLFDTLTRKFHNLNSQDVIKYLRPQKTDIFQLDQLTKKYEFKGSAHAIDLPQTAILSISLLASSPLEIWADQTVKTGTKFELENINNLQIVSKTEKSRLLLELKSLELRKLEINYQYRKLLEKFEQEKGKFDSLNGLVRTVDYSQRFRLLQEISQIKIVQPVYPKFDIEQLDLDIEKLQLELEKQKNDISVEIIVVK